MKKMENVNVCQDLKKMKKKKTLILFVKNVLVIMGIAFQNAQKEL